MPSASISARTAPRVVDQIHEVFLSSTAKDLKEYRRNVKDSLELSKAEVFLQEKWAEPARDVVELCLQRLGESDAYMGVFGYRYGWIPEGYEKSITELECDHAFRLWHESQLPPIFLFIPETGSQAGKELERLANRILQLDHPQEPQNREESKRQQAGFRNRLIASGRFVRQFDSLAKLCMLAPTSVSNWNLAILKSALLGRRNNFGGIPLEDLGAIGRDRQISALEKAVATLELSSSPGMCMLIHGREGAGQLAFRKFLESWDGWGLEHGTPRMITPPHDLFDQAALRSTAFGVIAPGKVPTQATFDELAEAMLAQLAKAPLVLMLSRFESLEGIEDFHRSFWAPLLSALCAKTANAPPPNRVTMVLTSLSPLPAVLPSYIWPGSIDARHVDGTRLLPLPELTDLSDVDVNMWLNNLGVDTSHRVSIATAVTREDGVPRNVYDRLNTNGFWATLGS
jgi:hypothetical protein